jgi:hypothetical protein
MEEDFLSEFKNFVHASYQMGSLKGVINSMEREFKLTKGFHSSSIHHLFADPVSVLWKIRS